jgi:hypothetical protein
MNKKLINFKVVFAVIFGIFLMSVSFAAVMAGESGGPRGEWAIRSVVSTTVETYLEVENRGQYVDPNQGDNSLNSYLKLSVISPFGDVLTSQTKRFKSCKGCEQFNDAIQLDYRGFSGDFSIGSDKELYCTVGGLYKIVTELKIVIPSGKSSKKDRDLYSCPTTKDLYKLVKIPSEWVDNNLLIYCNDGLKAGYSELGDINFEFLSNVVNSYKVCIVKNQDLSDDNTIIYGLEYGLPTILSDKLYRNINPNVRAEEGTVFNTELMSGTLVADLETGTDEGSNGDFKIISYEHDLDKEYILEYNNLTYEFVLYNKGLELDTPLTDYYDLDEVSSSNVTRSVIVKNKEDGEKIVGYDISGAEMEIRSRLPIYYINNIGFNQQDTCLTYLGKYGAIVPNSAVSAKIGCLDTGLIEINSNGFFPSSKNEPFNIYKNIVFGYK